MDRKKMITYAAIAVVVLIILWQGMGMLGGDSEDASLPITKPNPDTPKVATLLPVQKAAQQAPLTEREIQLMKLQQETQAKYLAALNELQMLKVEKDIAETNRDVSKARLENITAQKNIVDLLSPTKPVMSSDTYAQGLDPNAAAAAAIVASTTPAVTTTTTTTTTSDTYKVVSVTKLRGQWMAVLGVGGALYSVKQGDILPTDSSVVISIDRSGVQLEKEGKIRKISMVPII